MLGKSHANIGFLVAIMAKAAIANGPLVGVMLIFNIIPRLMIYGALLVLILVSTMWPEKTIPLYAPISVLIGSLFPDLDHPNSTLSTWIAPTDFIIKIMVIVSGFILMFYNWGMNIGLFAGGLLLFIGIFMTWILPLEKLKRLLLITSGVILIAFVSSKIALWVGIIYLAMGILSHRGLTHSLEGLIICTLGAVLLTKSLGVPELLKPFIIGYAAHLLADTVTDTGIHLSYFANLKVSLPLIKTAGTMDRLIGIVVMAIVIFYSTAGVLQSWEAFSFK